MYSLWEKQLTIMCSSLPIDKPNENKVDSTTKFELKGRDDCQSTNLSSLCKFGNQQTLL